MLSSLLLITVALNSTHKLRHIHIYHTGMHCQLIVYFPIDGHKAYLHVFDTKQTELSTNTICAILYTCLTI